MAEIKEPIRIRRKKLTNGNVSLYLDIYLNGKREYEFLKLYLIPEKTKADREANRQTLQLANSIKARRIVEVQNGEHGFKSAYASDTLFFDYYRAMCARRLGAESTGNWGNWKSCLKHLQKYEPNERIRFSQITQEWVQGFRDYLEKDACAWSCDERDRIKDHPLSRNSRVSYFNKLRACLNQAYEDRIIPINPMRGVEGFKAEEGTRMYLTIEEVQRLAQTECEYPAIKRAFLFSCLTGLRRSDVIRLTWGDVHQQESSLGLSSNRRRPADRNISTSRRRPPNSWASAARTPSISSPTSTLRVAPTKRSKGGYCGPESIRI